MNGFSVGVLTALSTSYTGIALHAVSTTDDASEDVPPRCDLSWLHGQIDTISGAAAVTWYLAADEDGDIPLTDEVTETILVGDTTATDGSVATTIDLPYRAAGFSTAGVIWVFAKVDAGTCNLTPRVFWRVR